jgi:cutinase
LERNSQGAAVLHGSISTLSSDIQNQILGVVTFGDTRNKQDKGQIPNFPKDKIRIFCAPFDVLCLNLDLISPTHFSYVIYVSSAIAWIKDVLN